MIVDRFSCDRMVNRGSSEERLRLHLASHPVRVAQSFQDHQEASALGAHCPSPSIKRRLGA